MMTKIGIPCLYCLHYRGERRCAAFQDEIPHKFWFFDEPHVRVVEGQQGNFVFTPDPDKDPDWPYLPRLRRFLGLEPIPEYPEE